jgi:hypothetical protein
MTAVPELRRRLPRVATAITAGIAMPDGTGATDRAAAPMAGSAAQG